MGAHALVRLTVQAGSWPADTGAEPCCFDPPSPFPATHLHRPVEAQVPCSSPSTECQRPAAIAAAVKSKPGLSLRRCGAKVSPLELR